MEETKTNLSFIEKINHIRANYRLFSYSAYFLLGGLILGILTLVLGLIGVAAFFFNIALFSILLLIFGYFQIESVKHGIMEWWNNLVTRVRKRPSLAVVYILGFLVIYFVINYVLSILLPINFLQQNIIAIIVASNLIMVSVGLTLTTRVRKFANFAQAEFVIFGVYVAIAFEEILGGTDSVFQWIFIMVILAFLFTGIVGLLTEALVWGPLTRREATPLSLMVASIGVGLIIRQTLQEIFGSVPRTSSPNYPAFFEDLAGVPILRIFFQDRSVVRLPFDVTMRISRDQAWTIVVMILMIYLLNYIFTRTTVGISMRATADDPDLAEISGINTRFVIYFTWFLAAGVSGVGALFFFEAAQIQPGSGFVQLLLIFAVVVLGGFDSFEGTVISGFIISYTMSAAVIINGQLTTLEGDFELLDKMVFWSTSGDWKLVIAFAILIFVLIFRPRGIFGLVDPRSKL